MNECGISHHGEVSGPGISLPALERAFEPAERKDSIKAMGYVYGEECLKAKALIMGPIDEFRRPFTARINAPFAAL